MKILTFASFIIASAFCLIGLTIDTPAISYLQSFFNLLDAPCCKNAPYDLYKVLSIVGTLTILCLASAAGLRTLLNRSFLGICLFVPVIYAFAFTSHALTPLASPYFTLPLLTLAYSLGLLRKGDIKQSFASIKPEHAGILLVTLGLASSTYLSGHIITRGADMLDYLAGANLALSEGRFFTPNLGHLGGGAITDPTLTMVQAVQAVLAHLFRTDVVTSSIALGVFTAGYLPSVIYLLCRSFISNRIVSVLFTCVFLLSFAQFYDLRDFGFNRVQAYTIAIAAIAILANSYRGKAFLFLTAFAISSIALVHIPRFQAAMFLWGFIFLSLIPERNRHDSNWKTILSAGSAAILLSTIFVLARGTDSISILLGGSFKIGHPTPNVATNSFLSEVTPPLAMLYSFVALSCTLLLPKVRTAPNIRKAILFSLGSLAASFAVPVYYLMIPSLHYRAFVEIHQLSIPIFWIGQAFIAINLIQLTIQNRSSFPLNLSNPKFLAAGASATYGLFLVIGFYSDTREQLKKRAPRLQKSVRAMMSDQGFFERNGGLVAAITHFSKEKQTATVIASNTEPSRLFSATAQNVRALYSESFSQLHELGYLPRIDSLDLLSVTTESEAANLSKFLGVDLVIFPIQPKTDLVGVDTANSFWLKPESKTFVMAESRDYIIFRAPKKEINSVTTAMSSRVFRFRLGAEDIAAGVTPIAISATYGEASLDFSKPFSHCDSSFIYDLRSPLRSWGDIETISDRTGRRISHNFSKDPQRRRNTFAAFAFRLTDPNPNVPASDKLKLEIAETCKCNLSLDMLTKSGWITLHKSDLSNGGAISSIVVDVPVSEHSPYSGSFYVANTNDASICPARL